MAVNLKEHGWKAVRASGHGRNRAAFWRALGFPNMARARAAYAKIRAERKLQAQQSATSVTTPPPTRKRPRL